MDWTVWYCHCVRGREGGVRVAGIPISCAKNAVLFIFLFLVYIILSGLGGRCGVAIAK
jgi:hypothetical protein